MNSDWWQEPSVKESISWLEDQAKKLIDGCRIRAKDGTVLYCPDGKGHYAALWTRDFSYMVENCPDMIPMGALRRLQGGIDREGSGSSG